MSDTEDLTIRAAIRDELSAPLADIRDELRRVGTEAGTTATKADSGARGLERLGKAGRVAGRLLKYGAAGVAAMGFAAYKLGKSAITQASDLNESLNAVNVSYGKQAKAVQKLGRQAATALGLSNVEFNGLSVRFSSFAKTIGGGGKGTVKTLDNLTKRASDFASVMNLDVSDAAELFQSGLAGESEPLRAYGIDLSAASVAAYAYANGIAESGDQLTQTQKVQATYGSLMKQTAQVQGDFKNTSDQLANSQRILGARWDNAQAKLGKALLPMMTTVVGYLNREGIPAFKRLSDWFVNEGIPKIQGFVDKARPLAEKLLPAVKDSVVTIKDALADALPYAEDLVDAFNGLPAWAKKGLVLGGAGAAVGAKLGLGKLAGKGASAAVSAFTKSKPMPVWVVNNGGGLPDKPGKPGAPVVTGPAGREVVEKAAGKDAGKAATAAAMASRAFPLTAILAAAYASNTSSQAPGQQATYGSSAEGINSIMGGMSAGKRDTYALGASTVQEFDAALSKLNSNAARYSAIKDFMAATFHNPDAKSNFDALNEALPLTNRRLGETAGEFVRNRETAKDLDRVLTTGRTTTDNYALAMSGLGGNAKAAGGKAADLGGTLGGTLTPRMADAAGKAGSLATNLDKVKGNRVGSVTVNGLDTANQGVLNLLGNLGNLGNFTASLAGLPPVSGKREHGGPVTKGKAYIVGERRPEVFVPHTSGRIEPRVTAGGGAVVVEAGGITVHVANPGSDVDVAEAVTQGIRDYVREREERA